MTYSFIATGDDYLGGFSIDVSGAKNYWIAKATTKELWFDHLDKHPPLMEWLLWNQL